MSFNPKETLSPGAKIKVIGVGGGGTNAVSSMINEKIEGVEFISANTDVQSLTKALAPLKIQLGKDLTKGLGAGADPDIGRDAALEDRHEIQEALSGADMVFITVGMGGGTGTGSASVIAQIARELGALTVAVVTKPFTFEGKRRLKHAETGIETLAEHVDTLLTIPNQRLLQIANANLSLIDAFKMADDVLVNAVKGISDIINIPGTINVDFADVKTIMSSMGQALMGIGIASGENRASQAAQQAVSSPLLEDVNIEGATGILINITAGKDISLLEINEACMIIQEAAHEDANIIFGAVVEESTGDEMRVTVIATGFPGETPETHAKQELYHKKTYSQMYQKQTPPLLKKPTRNRTNYNQETVVNTQASLANTSTNIQKEHSFKFFKKEPAVTKTTTTTTNNPVQNLQKNNTTQTPTLTKPVFNPQEPPHTLKTEKTTPDSTFNFTTDTNLNTKTKTEQEQEPTVNFEQTNTTSNEKKQETPYINNSLQQGLDENIDKKIDEALQLAERVNNMTKTKDELDVPTFLRQTPKGPGSVDND